MIKTSRKKAARLLFQLPRGCRTYLAIDPSAQWGWLESFANRANYLLELKLWQDTPIRKGQQAAHNQRKPKPYVPDFMKKGTEPEGAINKDVEKMSVDDVKSWLAVPRGV